MFERDGSESLPRHTLTSLQQSNTKIRNCGVKGRLIVIQKQSLYWIKTSQKRRVGLTAGWFINARSLWTRRFYCDDFVYIAAGLGSPNSKTDLSQHQNHLSQTDLVWSPGLTTLQTKRFNNFRHFLLCLSWGLHQCGWYSNRSIMYFGAKPFCD